jgi:hypothetical protein
MAASRKFAQWRVRLFKRFSGYWAARRWLWGWHKHCMWLWPWLWLWLWLWVRLRRCRSGERGRKFHPCVPRVVGARARRRGDGAGAQTGIDGRSEHMGGRTVNATWWWVGPRALGKALVRAEAYPGRRAGMRQRCAATDAQKQHTRAHTERERERHTATRHTTTTTTTTTSRSRGLSIAVSAWPQAGCGAVRATRGSARRARSTEFSLRGAAAFTLAPIHPEVRAGFYARRGCPRGCPWAHGESTATPKTSGLALMHNCAAPSCFYTSRVPSRRPTAASYLSSTLPPLPAPLPPPTLLLPRRRDRLDCGPRLGLRP